MRVSIFAASLSLLLGCTPSLQPEGYPGPALRYPETTAAPKPPPAAAALQTPARVDLESYIAEATANNPALESSRLRYLAARQREPQASSLPDPMLMYGYFVEEVETRNGPQEQRTGISQQFPWFGKRRLRGDIAATEARIEGLRLTAEKNELMVKVTEAYVELAYLDAARAATEDKLEILHSFEQVLSEQLRAGAGRAFADLTKVQLELGVLEDRLLTIREQSRPLETRMRALLGRLDGSSIAVSPAILSYEPALPATLPRPVENPRYLLQLASTQAAALGIELAEKQYFPDVTIGAEYVQIGERSDMPGSGNDAILGTLSFNLPVYWARNSAAVQEARLRSRSSEQAAAAKLLELESELASAQFEFRDAGRKIALYQHTLVPKAEEALQANITAYQAGEVDFLDLLDAEQRLLEYELALARARADRLIAVSETVEILGGLPDE